MSIIFPSQSSLPELAARNPQPHVTSNLAPNLHPSHNCLSKGSTRTKATQPHSGQESCLNPFALKILTSKSFGLRILRTNFC
jgi:hypothetical protein